MTEPVYRLTKGDILTASILVALSIFFIADASLKPQGGEAVIFIDNRLIATIDLSADNTHEFAGKIGIVKVSVRDGELRVTDADCPLHLCMKSGNISRDGEIIVCLPNRFVAVIKGGDPRSLHGVTG